jgi:SAM-dependent methyltransferase
MSSNVKCRLCGCETAVVWFIAWEHKIYRCRRCGFVFAARLAGARAPDYESDYHSAFIERDLQPEILQQYAKTLKELESMAPGCRLLDIGCGAGGFLNFAKGLGWSVSGIDGSRSAVQHAVETYNLNVMVADLNQHQLPLGAYDVIWSFHVVEHLFDPVHMLRSAASALAPNGLMFVGTPRYSRVGIQLHQLLFKMKAANHPYNFNLPDHLSYFNESTLRIMISIAGLREVRTWFTSPRSLADLAVEARGSRGMRKGIGTIMLPLGGLLRNIRRYHHVNMIARKVS